MNQLPLVTLDFHEILQGKSSGEYIQVQKRGSISTVKEQ